jgi:hypothetical protein
MISSACVLYNLLSLYVCLMMTSEKEKTIVTRLSNYFFVFLLLGGGILLTYSLVTAGEGHYFGGLQQIAAGITLIGLGEWINHPLQKSLRYKDRQNFIFQKIRHRERKPNGLGNIIEIAGVLMIFTGLAEYI